MRHIIKKQVLDINLEQTKDAFQIQNDLSSFYWNQIVPILEKVFNEISREDEIIQMDLLELDLGNLRSENIRSGQPGHDLFEQLYKQVSHAFATTKTIPAEEKAKSFAAQWLHYMEKGWLNWNTLEIDREWEHKVLEILATDYVSITALRLLVQKDSRARARIAMRHDEVFLLRLIEVLTAQKQASIPLLIRELSSAFEYLGIPFPNVLSKLGSIDKTIWCEAIYLSAIHANKMNASELAAEILRLFITDRSSPVWKRIVTAGAPLGSQLRKIFYEKVIRDTEDRPLSIQDNDKEIAKEALEKILEKQKVSRQETEKQLLEDGIFVKNAGLVLLHPFLVTFFTRLELIKDGQFIDTLSHQRALHLLNYLAMGKEAAEEHELLMPKILLNYPMEELVSLDIHLADSEKGEADHLLATVIAKWEILRNTSKAGLREGFLQRGGKYFSKNDNYYLQVEQGSIDVLLDHLPWNVGIIKLPWMNQMLRVEWR